MTNVTLTQDQRAKLLAATERYGKRVRAIGRKHRTKIAALLQMLDGKRAEAIQTKIKEGK